MNRRRGTLASRRVTPSKPTGSSTPTAMGNQQTGTTATTKSNSTVMVGRNPTPREIRDRAYYIFLARGGVNGDSIADWMRAERELRDELRHGQSVGRRY